MPRNAIATTTEPAPTWAAELTPREQRFVEEYVVDLSAKAAAIRAGLGKTPKSATEIASRMRKKAHVATAISALIAERSGVTGAAVLNEIAQISFAKIGDYVRIENGKATFKNTSELSADEQAAIKEIITDENGCVTGIKLHDKIAALEKVARICGLYHERETASQDNEAHWRRMADARESVGDRIIARLKAMRKRALESQQTILLPPAAPMRAPAPPVIIDAD